MAPSPEVGQPKAPDKCDSKQPTLISSISITTTSTAVPVTSIDSTTNHHSGGGGAGSAAGPSIATTSNPHPELETLDDIKLKELLYEAYTYKNPRDRENKSDLFKGLLNDVEKEEQDRDYQYMNILARSSRSNGGGSLQDLGRTVNSVDISQSRRHHYSSRQKKETSVSSRQCEGGSLPSCNIFPYDQPFLTELNKRKNKVSATPSSRPSIEEQNDTSEESLPNQNEIVIDIGDHDYEETHHLLAHDSLARGVSDPLGSEECGIELFETIKKHQLPRLPINYTSHQIVNVDVSVGEASRANHNVDKTVQFGPLTKHTKKTFDMNTTMQLNNSYVAVNSCMDSKLVGLNLSPQQQAKFSAYPPSLQFVSEQKHLDENGNSVQTFNSTLGQSSNNPLKSKSKNKKREDQPVVLAQHIEGNRGNDNIDELLAFIESGDTNKKNGIVNSVNNNSSNSSNSNKALIGSEKNKKNKSNNNSSNKNNKNNNKLKKSNSLEELKSASKLEDEIAQAEGGRESTITLRHKNAKKHMSESKEAASKQQQSHSQSQHKRGERRSWGTEELSYLGDTTTILVANQPKDVPIKKSKDTSKLKKKDEQSLSMLSIDSLANETAEFHVVTKKKKTKKRTTLEEARHKQQHRDHVSMHQHNRNKYQPSSHYTNDRDIYMNPFNANDNRRKSTSSVPPSEKSDSSDLDSVHSLPIESTSTRQQNAIPPTSTSSGGTPQASYADIARISNPEKTFPQSTLDKWPTVSNSKNPESPDNSNGSTCSTMSGKSNLSHANSFFSGTDGDISVSTFDASSNSSTSSNSTIVKPILYSQSLIDDNRPIGVVTSPPHDDTKRMGPKLQTHIEVNNTEMATAAVVTAAAPKNVLQKSKSVDTDNYINMNNIEQYPALEKTVKPQRQPFMPNVATEPTKPGSGSSKITKVSTSTTVKPTELGMIVNKKQIGKVTKDEKIDQSKYRTTATISIQPIVPTLDQETGNDSYVTLNTIGSSIPNPTAIPSATSKKGKKDKASKANKSSRPAVIILNDNDKCGNNVSPLLFGDFRENEFNFFEDKADVETIQNNGLPTKNKSPKQTTTSTLNEHYSSGFGNISLQSDPGYSSSAYNHSLVSTESSFNEQHSKQPPQHYHNKPFTQCDLNIDCMNDVPIDRNQSMNNLETVINNNVSVETVSDSIISNVSTSTMVCNADNKNNNYNNFTVVDTNNDSYNSSNASTVSLGSNEHMDDISQPLQYQSKAQRHKGQQQQQHIQQVPISNSKIQQISTNNNNNWEHISTCGDVLYLRYKPPPMPVNVELYNHDMIVDFVGSAWEDDIITRNDIYFYNGQ